MKKIPTTLYLQPKTKKIANKVAKDKKLRARNKYSMSQAVDVMAEEYNERHYKINE